jgi:hypothetical protein
MDRIQVAALILAVVVAAVVGVLGIRITVGYVSCHQKIESIGAGLTPAYDPLTDVCTVRI